MVSHPGENSDVEINVDVVIIGGGPAGSTVGTLLRKYNPDLSVMIIEKAMFPREHVGESQLPGISSILDEMGVWDKIEAANFPIKLGASYTWGKDADVWDFDFYPAEEFTDETRPAKYEGQRRFTAFQVERDRYDDILLNHAQEMGAQVHQLTKVRDVLVDDGRVIGLKLDSGKVIRARHYVDCSGDAAILRKAIGVESVAPTHLRNIAFWDYYENATWAVEIGIGGTRVQIRSLPYGWMWFIPLGPSRASVGLICPSEYYKSSGMTPEELYRKAISDQGEIGHLLKDAKSDTDGEVQSAKNWSHLANKIVGENWWLCGSSAGFADPILAAGMTLAHTTARHVAYSILEIEHGEIDPEWIKSEYDETGRRNINQHIRFAEYWYAANGRFTDLQEYCKDIAKEAGLNLNPSQAWRWLAQGGFTNQSIERAGFGTFDVGSSKRIIEQFSGRDSKYQITKLNEFKLNLKNVKEIYKGQLVEGRIQRVPCYKRGESVLPMIGTWRVMVDILKQESDLETIYKYLADKLSGTNEGAQGIAIFVYLQTLEVMVNQGWVIGKHNKKRPLGTFMGGRLIRSETQMKEALTNAKGTIKFANEDTE